MNAVFVAMKQRGHIETWMVRLCKALVTCPLGGMQLSPLCGRDARRWRGDEHIMNCDDETFCVFLLRRVYSDATVG